MTSNAPDKSLVLLCNDDGFNAPGFSMLHNALAGSFDIFAVAPATDQSGVSHGFSFSPLYCEEMSIPFKGVSVTGTPADCVKIALSRLIPRKPDMIVSGLNFGENSGTSGFYSGTVAAAREGAFWRIPSFAFSSSSSVLEFNTVYASWSSVILTRLLLVTSGKRPVYYNVNFPDCAPEKCKGIKITRQSMAYFDDAYKSVINSSGREGYVVFGKKAALEESDDFDSRALENGYTTITPLHFDATANELMDQLNIISKDISLS